MLLINGKNPKPKLNHLVLTALLSVSLVQTHLEKTDKNNTFFVLVALRPYVQALIAKKIGDRVEVNASANTKANPLEALITGPLTLILARATQHLFSTTKTSLKKTQKKWEKSHSLKGLAKTAGRTTLTIIDGAATGVCAVLSLALGVYTAGCIKTLLQSESKN